MQHSAQCRNPKDLTSAEYATSIGAFSSMVLDLVVYGKFSQQKLTADTKE